jgi:hypothetical protein
MNNRSHPLWPTLIVLAGYVTADLFLHRIQAALFVAGLGLVEFLILLVIARIAMPSLLIEGAVLGCVGYAGELIGEPGAGFMILELTAALAFLASTAVGRPYLDRQLRNLTGSGMNRDLAGRMTLLFGMVFLVHGVFLLGMMFTSGISTPAALLSFAALYLAAMVWFRKKSRREASQAHPVLVTGELGGTRIELGGSVLGRVRVEGEQIVEVTILALAETTSSEGFIPALETALAASGARTVRFPCWSGDTSPLEMAGYSLVSGCWQKVLPRDTRSLR